MQSSVNSLFSRVRGPLGRALLALTPPAVLGLAASPVHAVAIITPTFNPNGGVTYGPDANFSYTSGTLAGTSLPLGSNFVYGANYYGGPVSFTAGTAGVVVTGATLVAFSITGTGSGALSRNSDEFSGVYHFDLAATAAGAGLLTITNWTLTYRVTTTGTSGGTSSGSVSGSGTGDFTGTVLFPIAGADSGASLLGYAAFLSVTYMGVYNAGSVLSVTVPNGSIDFNAVPTPSAVPEPGTWALALAGSGLLAAGVRRARPRSHVGS